MTNQDSHTRAYDFSSSANIASSYLPHRADRLQRQRRVSAFLSPCYTEEHIGGEIFLVLLTIAHNI